MTRPRYSRDQGDLSPPGDRTRDGHDQGGDPLPAKTEKQRRFMGAELERKREGKKTQTGMSEKELEKMASKDKTKKS